MADSRAWKNATAGTHVDAQAPRGVAAAFLVVAFALILLPFVGMAWARTDVTTENRELSAWPAAVAEDGSPNVNILEDLGIYFDDHFAYRNEAVTVNARLRAALGTSATDQVVVGTRGWLYYGGTLPDYLGQGQLTDRGLANIAHNLRLAQDYAAQNGAEFVFALAPNKNTLDASSMPYYYLPYQGASNFERLKPYLDAAGVNYVDLFGYFTQEQAATGVFGYLKLDSHWDNRWALLAANELMESVGHAPVAADPDTAFERIDFAGDLQSMLYPAAEQLEANYYYEGFNDLAGFAGSRWHYEEGSDVTESTIRTSAVAPQPATAGDESPASGCLLMFRDSFGNALLPFMAASFEQATFSKLVPYNFTQVAQLQASTVVVERAERHLSYLAENPPILSNPRQNASEGLPEGARLADATVSVETSGSYWVVTGSVNEELEPSTQLFLVADPEGGEPQVFDPFWVSVMPDSGDTANDRGYLAYAPVSAIDLAKANVNVYVA